MTMRNLFTRLEQGLDRLADGSTPAYLSALGIAGSLAFVGLGARTATLLAIGQTLGILFGILLATFTLKAIIAGHLRGLIIRTAQLEAAVNAQGVRFDLLTHQLRAAQAERAPPRPAAQPDIYELDDPDDHALRHAAVSTRETGGTRQ